MNIPAVLPPRDDRRLPVLKARHLVGAFVRVASAALVVFHGFLLWDRVASLTLLDPVIAVRWGVTATLLVGLVRLWRSGESLLSGRKALAIWSLVILLHASMAPGVGGLTATLAEADSGLWLTLSLSGLLILLGARANTSQVKPGHGQPGSMGPEQTPAFRIACLALLSPRPPPAI